MGGAIIRDCRQAFLRFWSRPQVAGVVYRYYACFPSMRGGFDSLRPHQFNPKIHMKFSKILLVVAALLGASFASAVDAPASQKAKCDLKAEKAGKTCDHACCVASAKEGKNCEKCGGTNVAAAKK